MTSTSALHSRASLELVPARKVMDRWAATYPTLMRRLERLTLREPPFLSAGVFTATAALLGLERPIIFAADRHGVPASALLLYRKGRTLHGLRSDRVPRFDVVGRSEDVPTLWRALQAERSWDVLSLRDVPESSALVRELPALSTSAGYRWRIRPGRVTARFSTRHMSPQMEEALCGSSLLSSGAEASIISRRDDDAFDDAIPLLRNGGGRPPSDDGPAERFYRQLLRGLARRRNLVLSFLEVAGERIAAQLAADQGGTRYVLSSGRHPEVDPGAEALLLWESARQAKDRGITRVDCLGIDLPSPPRWGEDAVGHVMIEVFRSTPLGAARYYLSRPT